MSVLQGVVDLLTKQHMPKKERRRGWFSWGRTVPAPQENSSLSPREGSTAESPQPGTSGEKKVCVGLKINFSG